MLVGPDLNFFLLFLNNLNCRRSVNMLSIYSGSCGNQTTKYYAKYKGRDADRFRLNVLKRNGECFDANLFSNGCFLRKIME